MLTLLGVFKAIARTLGSHWRVLIKEFQGHGTVHQRIDFTAG